MNKWIKLKNIFLKSFSFPRVQFQRRCRRTHINICIYYYLRTQNIKSGYNPEELTPKYPDFIKQFKTIKQNADIYNVTPDEDKEKVEEVLDQYDTFVFFNGSALAPVFDLLKENEKTIYTFDIYEATLKELQAGGTYLKGILAQNTFEMGAKAVEAVLNNSKEDQWISPIYITKDNLDDPSVKPFLDFYKDK